MFTNLSDHKTAAITKDNSPLNGLTSRTRNQYTLFDSPRFIHSDCGSSPVKMAMPTGEHCWKKNSDAPWARTSNLWIPSLTRSPLSYLGRYVERDLKFYCRVLYIAIMLHLTAEPRGRPVASSMYFLLKQKILPFMKLGELYVHIYYYALNNIYYIKLLLHA